MTSTPPHGDLAFAASPGQRRLWFLHQVSPESAPAYTLAVRLDLHGDPRAADLQYALNHVVARHEALRTSLRLDGGELLQIVQDGVSVVLDERDLRGERVESREPVLERVLRNLARRGWDLGRSPLLRAVLVRMTEDHAVLGLCVHHTVCDGLSLQVLLEEILETCRRLRTGQPREEDEPSVQFADFVVWNAGGEEPDEEWNARRRELLDDWQERLAALPTGLDLPADRRRPARQSFEGARLAFTLEPGRTDRLRRTATECGVSLSTLMLTAYLTVLHHAAGSDDVAVGIPVANRCRPELQATVGYVANTCVLRERVAGERRLRDLARQVHQDIGWLMQRSDLPFGDLVEGLNPPRLLDRNPLFSVLFGFQPDVARRHRLPGLRAEIADMDTGTSRLDLSLFLFEEPRGGVSGFLEYATALFDEATVARMGRHLHLVLDRFADGNDDEVGAALSQAAEAWPAPTAPCGPRTTVLDRIVRQTRLRPDAPALRDGTGTLTFRQIDDRVGAAAARLRLAGAGPGRRVVVHTTRGIGTVVAMLATWRAGAVYVPVDPSLPARRRTLIVRQAAPAVIVTSADAVDVTRPRNGGEETAAVHLPIDCLLEDVANTVNDGAPNPPDSAAYLMFTSGSTGEPKAIAVTHANLAYFLDAFTETTGLSADDTLLALTTHAFDISLPELLAPLTTGGTVVIAPRDALRDGAELRRRLDPPEVTIAQATPATWRLLADAGWRPRPDFTVLCGGEALPADLADILAEGSAAAWNLYGPTETTVWSCAAQLRPGAAVHLGHPLPGTTCVVAGPDMRPVPEGTSGELLIAGPGVAAGYVNRPALTAARFLPDPQGRGNRLYRTGDKVRRRADGTLEFLGRMDDQVKIRGHRIELGEIEHVLREAAGVRDAAATLIDHAGHTLVGAWLVPRADVTASDRWAADVRRHAAARLPEASVPARFHTVGTIPLNPHGKTDRRMLPRTGTPLDMPSERVEPRDETEAEIAALWQELLGVATVGATDDFFLLGGHSLLVGQMMHRIKSACGVTVPMSEIFLDPTVAGIARSVTARRGTHPSPTVADFPADETDWDFDLVPRTPTEATRPHFEGGGE